MVVGRRGGREGHPSPSHASLSPPQASTAFPLLAFICSPSFLFPFLPSLSMYVLCTYCVPGSVPDSVPCAGDTAGGKTKAVPPGTSKRMGTDNKEGRAGRVPGGGRGSERCEALTQQGALSLRNRDPCTALAPARREGGSRGPASLGVCPWLR